MCVATRCVGCTTRRSWVPTAAVSRLLWRRYSTRPHPTIDRVIRIDHAGEFGANRIYAGQMAVLGNTSTGPLIQVGQCATLLLLSNDSRGRGLLLLLVYLLTAYVGSREGSLGAI